MYKHRTVIFNHTPDFSCMLSKPRCIYCIPIMQNFYTIKYDNEVYKEATSYRRNFIVDNLQKILVSPLISQPSIK